MPAKKRTTAGRMPARANNKKQPVGRYTTGRYSKPVSKGSMTVAEAGRLGGAKGGKIVREKYGHEFYEEIGRKGGLTVRQERGHGFYEEIGRKGGETVRAERGRPFYQQIGRKGGQRVRDLIREGKKATSSSSRYR